MIDAKDCMTEIRRHWLEGKAEDGFHYWPHRSASDDIKVLFAALARARCAAVEDAISFAEGGRFLHNDAPAARMAREFAKAAREHFGLPAPPTAPAALRDDVRDA